MKGNFIIIIIALNYLLNYWWLQLTLANAI